MNIGKAIVRKRYTDHSLFYSAILIWKLLFFLPLLAFSPNTENHVFSLYFVPYLLIIAAFRIMTYFASNKASFMEATEMGLAVFLIIADFYLIWYFQIPIPFGMIIILLSILHMTAAFSRFRWFRNRLWLSRHIEILGYLTEQGETPTKISVVGEDEMLVTTKSGREYTYRHVYWSGFYFEKG
ncbi:hypothetical protein [Exiguobacterium flavidum]|uniref:hypothetical protein n=1 Tax=Exiguobacterium flavidum TaxID=2184695 RepID=UPI000DF8498C|nr:hypothetical protein [Exiguobacterium flavidum]